MWTVQFLIQDQFKLLPASPSFKHSHDIHLKHKETDHSIDVNVRGRDNIDITLCRVIHLSTSDSVIDSRRGFLSGWSGLSYSSKLRRCTKMRVSVLINGLSFLWGCLMLDVCLPTNGSRKFKSDPPKKAAFRTKETIITRLKSKASQAWRTPTSRGVHLCSLMYTHQCLCPLKLHSPLSGFSSQRAHLEMRFKTAISVELCGVRRHRSDRGIVLCPKHNSKLGVRCVGGQANRKMQRWRVTASHALLCPPRWKQYFLPTLNPFSRIIIHCRCPSSDNDCLTTEIGN